MEDKELFNPQTGEKIAPKRPKKFYKDWRFYVYSLIALMLGIVSVSSALTACAAINAGVGENGEASYSVAQKKNAAITTDGGFSGYRFSLPIAYPSTNDGYLANVYQVDPSSYDLTLVNSSSGILAGHNVPYFVDLLDAQYSVGRDFQTSNPTYRYLLSVWAYSNPYNNSAYTSYNEMAYITFVEPAYTSYDGTLTNKDTAFICTTSGLWSRSISVVEQTYTDLGTATFFTLTNSKTSFYLFTTAGTATTATEAVFQDVASYYQELGYQDGYEAGYSEGNSDGYAAGESAGFASGYSDGLEVGNSNGEANGYANGYAAGLNASNYFKSITPNNDLVFFDILANITPYYTDGNGNLYYYRIFSAEVGEDFYYCWLCYYSTSNWSQWDVYLVWCDQSSSSGFTLDYLTNHSLGVWVVPKSNGAFSSVQSYSVYNPSIQTLDNAKVSLVYNVQMMQAFVTLDGGRTYGDVYKDGYTTGYQNGYNYGYELGETAGINAAEPEALTTTLVAVFQQPFNQIYRFFNFNILGLNILGLATGLLSVFIIIKVFKKVLK